MIKRYGEMDSEELLAEMDRLREEALQLQKSGNAQQIPVLEQKFYMAKSYLIDKSRITLGKTYEAEGYSEPFKVNRFNGAMVWGRFPSSTEEQAIPIGRLVLDE